MDLVNHGAKVAIANKYHETALDKCKGGLAKNLHDVAVESGQDLKMIKFKDQSWLGMKTRSRDATLSRHKGKFCHKMPSCYLISENNYLCFVFNIFLISLLIPKNILEFLLERYFFNL